MQEEKKITEERLNIEAAHLNNIFGSCDEYIKIIERNLKIKAVARGDELILTGGKEDVKCAVRV
ncbi:MAG: phosphate starvation-inducible protein PhoH, partial [Lachnospiraceae bacterium]|nr:phosphate starvation-inducible protein PhoH [Lachnospiraceae bacterium]